MTQDNNRYIQDAVQLLDSGNKSRALTLLQQAIRNNPQDDRAWMYFSLATDNQERKYSSLQRAIQINPTNDKAWVYLAFAGENLRQRLACLQRAAEINPSNTDVWGMISQVEAELKDLELRSKNYEAKTPPLAVIVGVWLLVLINLLLPLEILNVILSVIILAIAIALLVYDNKIAKINGAIILTFWVIIFIIGFMIGVG